jgi:hypothetical protein
VNPVTGRSATFRFSILTNAFPTLMPRGISTGPCG